jgi:hypothetical protein
VFVSYVDEKERYQRDQSFSSFSAGALDPHTTRKESRNCPDCHGHPKALGLGEGRFTVADGETFRPTYDTAGSGMPVTFPLDGITNVKGIPFFRSVDGTTRPFDGEEIERIRRVNACVACHRAYGDPIYRDFSTSMERFLQEGGLKCLGR